MHPGPDVVGEAGGLHAYMGRSAPLITDSGGFQIFSLARASEEDGPELKQRSQSKRHSNDASVLSVSEKGVSFRSYFDASIIELSPESSVAAQKVLAL